MNNAPQGNDTGYWDMSGDYPRWVLNQTNPNTGRNYYDEWANPNNTLAQDKAINWQQAPESMQHGPNNFMERLASYSPYIIGGMAAGGAGLALAGGGAAGAAGGGAGLLGDVAPVAGTVGYGATPGIEGVMAGGAAGAGGGGAAGWGMVDPSVAGGGAWAPNASWASAAPAAGGVGGAGGGTAPSASSGSFWDKVTGALGGTGGTGGGVGSSSGLLSTVKDWLPIASAIGGAFQGKQDQTTTQQTQMPDHLRALAPALTAASINAGMQPFQPYSGQRIEGFNPTQQQAFGQVQNLQNSPLNAAGSAALQRQMQGGDNPYLQGVVDKSSTDIGNQFNRSVLPNLDAMNVRANSGFGTSSAINGGGADSLRAQAYKDLGQTQADSSNQLRFQDYTNQQNRSLQAAGMVPGYNQMALGNTQALLNTGNQQQQLGQAQQDFNFQEFQRQLQYPEQQMRMLGYPFGLGNQGSTTTSTTPGAGPWAGAISGLVGGIGMGNTLGGNTPPPANPMMGQTYGQSYPPGYTTPWGTPTGYGG